MSFGELMDTLGEIQDAQELLKEEIVKLPEVKPSFIDNLSSWLRHSNSSISLTGDFTKNVMKKYFFDSIRYDCSEFKNFSTEELLIKTSLKKLYPDAIEDYTTDLKKFKEGFLNHINNINSINTLNDFLEESNDKIPKRQDMDMDPAVKYGSENLTQKIVLENIAKFIPCSEERLQYTNYNNNIRDLIVAGLLAPKRSGNIVKRFQELIDNKDILPEKLVPYVLLNKRQEIVSFEDLKKYDNMKVAIEKAEGKLIDSIDTYLNMRDEKIIEEPVETINYKSVAKDIVEKIEEETGVIIQQPFLNNRKKEFDNFVDTLPAQIIKGYKVSDDQKLEDMCVARHKDTHELGLIKKGHHFLELFPQGFTEGHSMGENELQVLERRYNNSGEKIEIGDMVEVELSQDRYVSTFDGSWGYVCDKFLMNWDVDFKLVTGGHKVPEVFRMDDSYLKKVFNQDEMKNYLKEDKEIIKKISGIVKRAIEGEVEPIEEKPEEKNVLSEKQKQKLVVEENINLLRSIGLSDGFILYKIQSNIGISSGDIEKIGLPKYSCFEELNNFKLDNNEIILDQIREEHGIVVLDKQREDLKKLSHEEFIKVLPKILAEGYTIVDNANYKRRRQGDLVILTNPAHGDHYSNGERIGNYPVGSIGEIREDLSFQKKDFWSRNFEKKEMQKLEKILGEEYEYFENPQGEFKKEQKIVVNEKSQSSHLHDWTQDYFRNRNELYPVGSTGTIYGNRNSHDFKVKMDKKVKWNRDWHFTPYDEDYRFFACYYDDEISLINPEDFETKKAEYEKKKEETIQKMIPLIEPIIEKRNEQLQQNKEHMALIINDTINSTKLMNHSRKEIYSLFRNSVSSVVQDYMKKNDFF
ncbi:MAG: hypothetical protein ABIB43_03220 [archaeon]